MNAKLRRDVTSCGRSSSMHPDKKRPKKRVAFEGLNFVLAIGFSSQTGWFEFLLPSATVVHRIFPDFQVFEINAGPSGNAGQGFIRTNNFQPRRVGKNRIHTSQQ